MSDSSIGLIPNLFWMALVPTCAVKCRLSLQRFSPRSIGRSTSQESGMSHRETGNIGSDKGRKDYSLRRLFGHGTMSDLSPLCTQTGLLPTTRDLWVHLL
jgi:hypothetical protein